MIPHDEPHRFLRWQKQRDDCQGWVSWLTETRTPHELVQAGDRWTIYKHRWNQEIKAWCCEGVTA